jgi:hypothetical protein
VPDRPGIRSLLCFALLAAGLAAPSARALGEPDYVAVGRAPGGMALWEEDRVASLYVDPDDFKGVHRAVDSLQADFVRASGRRPAIVTSAEDLTGTAIIIGSIGRSAVVDRLIAEGRIDVSAVRGRWEAWHIELVAQPVAGVDQALVIAGSDKRGTIFGVYDLSEQIGVSPWYWWADVPVRPSPSLYVKAGTRLQDAPTVRYRGIFLNDEAPALTGWVQENFGNYNHAFYEHVFELLLRLKSNFLWPAMWNNAFADDDPRNIVLADEYGIVMGQDLGTDEPGPPLRRQPHLADQRG